jgi:PAS domain-containing protein
LASALELAAQQEISRHAGRFETALNSMLHGLCMFDAEGRLIVCNARYAELYDFPPELTVPGTCEDAIRAYLATIALPDAGGLKSLAAIRDALTPDRAEVSDTCELADGRSIFVRYRLTLGSGLIDHIQKMTAAAMQIADMNVCAQRS